MFQKNCLEFTSNNFIPASFSSLSDSNMPMIFRYLILLHSLCLKQNIRISLFLFACNRSTSTLVNPASAVLWTTCIVRMILFWFIIRLGLLLLKITIVFDRTDPTSCIQLYMCALYLWKSNLSDWLVHWSCRYIRCHLCLYLITFIKN